MEIQKFNNRICEIYENEFPILDYIKLLNEKTCKIDISFIDDFIDLVNKDEPCINHELLKKYGVTQLTAGSIDVKKLLDRNKAVEGLDYALNHMADCDDYSHKIEYILHPNMFKKILIRSQNTDKYADYYLFLEKAIKGYSDYQTQYYKNKFDKKCSKSVLKLNKKSTLDVFIVCRNPDEECEYNLLIIKGQPEYATKKIEDLHIENVLLKIMTPHAVNFNNKLKEVFKKRFQYLRKECEAGISCTRYFKLKDINEQKFIDYINIIHFEHRKLE